MTALARPSRPADLMRQAHAEEAAETVAALLAWRAVDVREYDTEAWWDAMGRLRDLADRIGLAR